MREEIIFQFTFTLSWPLYALLDWVREQETGI
jgi:hypothetical protein